MTLFVSRLLSFVHIKRKKKAEGKEERHYGKVRMSESSSSKVIRREEGQWN